MGTTFLPILLQKYLSNPATKALSMSNFKITDLQAPTLNSDAATKQYVDAIAGGGGASTGVLPFNLTRGSGVGATTIGQFTNPTADDLQLTAPTTTGKLIFTDIHGVDFTNTPTTFTNSSGNVITVSPSGTTKGIRINGNNDPNAPLLEINSSAGERHFTSMRSGAVQQSQIYVGDSTTGGLTMVELVKGNNGTGLSMTKSGTGDGILITNNGTGYAISTAGTKGDVQIAGTLDQNGRIVQNTGGSQDTFSLTHSSGTGDGLHIVKNGTTGHALNIDNNGSGNSINATITTATGGVYIQKNTNSGAGIPLQINHQSNFTSGQSSVVVAHNTNAVGVDITGNGSTGVMLLTQNGAGYGLNVNKASGSGNGINILNGGDGNALDINRTNSTTIGDGINIVVDGSQAGSRAIRARIDTGSATTCEFRQNGSGNAVFIQTASNAGTGIEVLHNGNNATNAVVIRKEGAGGGAALDIRNLSSGDGLRVSDEAATDNSMFRIDQNGNVGIGVASASTLTNKVEINDSGVNSGLIINKSANGDGLLINKTAGSAGALAIVNSGSGSDATFYLENRSPGDCMRILDSTSPDTSMFRIDEDGRVGIGVGTGTLTDRFRSEGASGTASSLISQGTGTAELRAVDTLGTSKINVNSANTRINGRSSIILEPQISTNADDSTPRLRLTTSGAGATEDIIYQMAQTSGQGRHAFGVSGSVNTTMNIYTNEGSRRVRMGFLTATQGLGTGVCNILYDATIHTGTPHLFLESTTGATPAVAIDVNSMGRIANVADPVNAQDVATRAFVLAQPSTSFTLANSSSGNANGFRVYNLPDPAGYNPVLGDALPANPLNYNATSGVGRATYTNYRRSLAYPRLCCLFQNTQQTLYSNSSGNNNLDSITHLIYNNAAQALTSYYAATGNFINLPITVHTRTTSGNGRAGTFLLGLAGLYKITLYCNIGTSASPPTAAAAIPLQLVQGTATTLFISSVAPTYWFTRSDINNVYNGQNTRCAILQADFYVNSAGGTYVGFGSASSYNITADNPILQNNVSIFFEYLGTTYS